jgi:hypothetical protein
VVVKTASRRQAYDSKIYGRSILKLGLPKKIYNVKIFWEKEKQVEK